MVMTRPDSESEPQFPPTEGSAEFKANWVNKKRDKIVAEIQRNRRGEYKVPTWVLGVILLVVLSAWLAFVFLVG